MRIGHPHRNPNIQTEIDRIKQRYTILADEHKVKEHPFLKVFDEIDFYLRGWLDNERETCNPHFIVSNVCSISRFVCLETLQKVFGLEHISPKNLSYYPEEIAQILRPAMPEDLRIAVFVVQCCNRNVFVAVESAYINGTDGDERGRIRYLMVRMRTQNLTMVLEGI